jgi:hypothetical protein
MSATGSTWKRSDRALWRWTTGGVVLLTPNEAEPVVLNESGAALWDVLADARTPAEICEALAPDYGTMPERLTPDVDAFIEQLAAIGAIEIGSDGGGQP